jgi:hypothetical protein
MMGRSKKGQENRRRARQARMLTFFRIFHAGEMSKAVSKTRIVLIRRES